MQNDGYNAVLGENEQGMLRVIVASFDNKADAADSRDAIKAKYALTSKMLGYWRELINCKLSEKIKAEGLVSL